MKGVQCFDFICTLLCSYTSSFGGRLHNIRKSWSNTSISPLTKSVSGHSMLAFACTYRCLVVFLHMLVGNWFFKSKQFQALRYFKQKHIYVICWCVSRLRRGCRRHRTFGKVFPPSSAFASGVGGGTILCRGKLRVPPSACHSPQAWGGPLDSHDLEDNWEKQFRLLSWSTNDGNIKANTGGGRIGRGNPIWLANTCSIQFKPAPGLWMFMTRRFRWCQMLMKRRFRWC